MFNKVSTVIIAGIISILVLSFSLSIYQYSKLDFTPYINQIRMDISDIRYEVEKGNTPACKYDYLVTDLSGKVTYANGQWKYQKGDLISVEEIMQEDHSFSKEYENFKKTSFILQDRKGVCKGFVSFLIPKSIVSGRLYQENMMKCLLPVGVGIMLSVIILLWCNIFFHQRIINPLDQISQSAKAIIDGNYDKEVRRVYTEELKENEIGELTYSFELMRDELKSKQISEQSLRKAQQELMSCISHDLRTPISTIKAYSEGIRDGIMMEGMNQQDYVHIILEKTNLLEKMIGDLLTYSNTQLNKMVINRKEIYFRDYVIEIARELSIFVTQCGVEFSSEIMDENIIVNIDEKRITEVLYNLVENSLKYIVEERGKITFIAEISDGIPILHVKDNGMGISGADIPYVFDKFYRAEKSRNSDIPGSGLGLSICKYIVNQHDGEIYCRSRKSRGCEFWFTLCEDKL